MAYIGNDPSTIRQGRRAVYEFTATNGQTDFLGTDDNGLSLDLLQAVETDVYLNGSRLVLTDDYTISGDTLTLTSGAALNDIIVIVTQGEVQNAASYTKAEADARYINYDGDIVNGNIQVVGDIDVQDLTADGLTVDGITTVNGANLFVNNNVPTVRVTDTDLSNTYSEFRNVSGNAQIITRSDTANGIFSVWANDGSNFTQRLRIENNGDLAIYADDGTTKGVVWDASAGSLGIGTTTPSAGLHVLTDQNPVVKFDRGSANNANANWYYNGTFTGQVSAANQDFQISAVGASTPITLWTNGQERLRVDTNGNVGIGTTTTSKGKVNVVNSTKDAATYIQNTYAVPNNNDSGALYILDQASGNRGSVLNVRANTAHLGGSVARINVENASSTSTGLYINNAGSGYALNVDNSFYINSSGNVGIGTTSPSSKLEIDATSAPASGDGITIQNATSGDSSAGIFIKRGSTTATAIYTNPAFSNNNTTFSSDGSINFRTNNANRAELDSNGVLTLPYQPAFRSSGNTPETPNTDYSSTNIETNVGNHFNGTTFTAPVSGMYSFNANFRFYINNNNNARHLLWYLMRNGSVVYTVDHSQAVNTSSNNHNSVTLTEILYLSASDTVKVRFAGGDGTADFNGYGAFFSGHLIG